MPGAAGDFIRRSHARYRRLNSPAFAKCVHSRDFLRSALRIANEVNQSGGRFYHMNFQNGGHERGHFISFHFISFLEMKLKCRITAIGAKESPSVPVSIDGEIRSRFSLGIKFARDWRIKSRVSCVSDFKIIPHVNI